MVAASETAARGWQARAAAKVDGPLQQQQQQQQWRQRQQPQPPAATHGSSGSGSGTVGSNDSRAGNSSEQGNSNGFQKQQQLVRWQQPVHQCDGSNDSCCYGALLHSACLILRVFCISSIHSDIRPHGVLLYCLCCHTL